MVSPRPPRPQIDDADRRLLEYLAEHRVVVAPQIQALLGGSAAATERRVRALAGHGLLTREAIFAGQAAAVSITRRGLGAIGSRLPTPRVDLKGYRHDVGLGWLWLAAHDGAFGAVTAVHSEREQRSHDRRSEREGPPFGVRTGAVGPHGNERLHYADLLLETGTGHRVAVELELTAKSRRRMDQIMRGYAYDGRVDVVLYLVPSDSLARVVESAARRARISERVHVQRLAPGSPSGAPAPGRAPARSPGRGASRAAGTGERGAGR